MEWDYGNGIIIDYDVASDVLFIKFLESQGSIGKEVGDGITIHKTANGKLYGITIIDFVKRTEDI
jgi:uncharacterized protein YuzE